MKIFSWMRSTKCNGNDATNNYKPNPHPNSYGIMHEEFSDWPNGLLAIGTFGNNHNLKHSPKLVDEPELRLVINKDRISLENENENENENLLVDQLLDCLRHDGNDDEVDARVERQSSVVQRGSKEIQSDKRNRGGISKTASLSFLIKKALLCRGGFAVTPPIPRDPIPDSTMDKILRAMLHKKIYPQRPNTPKKYLDMGERESDDEEEEEEEEEKEGESEKANHESKWVKTDSEYIVLEI